MNSLTGQTYPDLRSDDLAKWFKSLYKTSNLASLKSVQRLGNILITKALPSTSGAALNTIAGTIPIDLMIEEDAAEGALRLMANNH